MLARFFLVWLQLGLIEAPALTILKLGDNLKVMMLQQSGPVCDRCSRCGPTGHVVTELSPVPASVDEVNHLEISLQC